ncbi:MAG: hypothetical protein ACUZ8E_00125 [Candidatus Anammoxibacter sp.]
MATTITFTINSIPAVDTRVSVTDTLTEINLSEIFKDIRSGFGESTLGTEAIGNPPSIINTAFFLKQALNIDYNNSFLYNITSVFGTDTVVVTALNEQSQFVLDANTTAGAVSIAINNDPFVPPLSIDAITILEASTVPCDNVKISTLLSEQADTINSPISQGVGTNPFVFEIGRANSISLEFQKGSDVITQELRIPKLLSVHFNISIVNTPNGASIAVNRLFPLTDAVTTEIFPLTFLYSLDGATWQTSNQWSGLPIDNYTMHVKDNIGCEINFAFTISAFTPNLVDFDPIAEISQINAIRFKENEVWDNINIFKTEENTLSFEENIKNPFTDFVQLIQKNDTKTTQIKTNYDTLAAVIIDCDGVEVVLPITKMIANMNKTDVRDVHAKNITSGNFIGRLGVYYGSGNTYDPITLVQNGTYNLGTTLPDWINIGDYISLQGLGWVLIEDIITFNNIKTIITNSLFAGSGFSDDQIVQGTSIFNQLNFDRYEFTIPFASLEGFYKVKVNLTHATFPAKEFISEWLDVKTTHPCHHLIDYYNTVNNEINYSTGIVHRLRVPFIKELQWKPNVEQDIYVSNTDTISLEFKERKFYDFNPMLLPTVMSQQLILVLGHDRLQIDTANYLLESEPESKHIGNRNEIKATLVKADYVFNSNSGIKSNEIILPQGTPLSIDENASGLLLIN